MYEPKDNTGTLWQNDRKEKDTHPDMRGDALIDGQWYWANAWTKRKKDGDKFLSLSFKPKDAPIPGPSADPEPEGEMPF